MSTTYRIGDLTVDTGRHRLLRGQTEIPIGPLTYQLLLTLIRSAPDAATHDRLVDTVWQGRHVSPETVKQRVKLLRDALSDDAHDPRYVELVRGQGYRLLPVPVAVEPGRNARGRVGLAVGAVVLMLAAALSVLRLQAPKPGAERLAPTIAVLPFTDLSVAQDQQYLADGIAEEIITTLSLNDSLRVIARTSSFTFNRQDVDIAEVARALRVSHVLEGSVRRWQDEIRIDVRLVDVADSSQVWSASYDDRLDNILSVQSAIAQSVASELDVTLSPASARTAVATRRIDPEAFELYLLGQHQLRLYTDASLMAAAESFEAAIRIDPSYLPAHYGLGHAYILQIVDVLVPMRENRERLRSAVNRAARLAPDDSGLIGLSAQLARYDGDFDLAERLFERALDIEPRNGAILAIYSMFKLDQGHPDVSTRLARRALEFDPLNHLHSIVIAFSGLDRGDAVQALTAASYLDDSLGPSRYYVRAVLRLRLLGDLAGSAEDSRDLLRIRLGDSQLEYGWPLVHYYLDDLVGGDAALEVARAQGSDDYSPGAAEAYRLLMHGNIEGARDLAISLLAQRKHVAGVWGDTAVLRLAVDALIARDRAADAVAQIERLAPEFRDLRSASNVTVKDFYPAPVPVKSPYNSYPALYLPDYVMALRAAGDALGAEVMLRHLEAILASRAERGLMVEGRHRAEALALRGSADAALDALEEAERQGTLFADWQLFLLHNSVFADVRDERRFRELIERTRQEMTAQRRRLADAPDAMPVPR